jgi:hypothetical protein
LVDSRLHVPRFAYAPFDLFTFVSGDPSQRAALLGGEAAPAVTVYLFARALLIDSGPLARRLARLWPYAVWPWR